MGILTTAFREAYGSGDNHYPGQETTWERDARLASEQEWADRAQEARQKFDAELAADGYAGWCYGLHTVYGKPGPSYSEVKACLFPGADHQWLPAAPAKTDGIYHQFKRFESIDALEARLGRANGEFDYELTKLIDVFTDVNARWHLHKVTELINKVDEQEAKVVANEKEHEQYKALANPFGALAALKGKL